MEVRPFGIRVQPSDTRTAFTANRRRTQASEAASAYADNMQRALAVVEHDSKQGSPPRPSPGCLSISCADGPRLRYPVASVSQRFAAVGRKLMPSGLFERVLMKYYRVR